MVMGTKHVWVLMTLLLCSLQFYEWHVGMNSGGGAVAAPCLSVHLSRQLLRILVKGVKTMSFCEGGCTSRSLNLSF